MLFWEWKMRRKQIVELQVASIRGFQSVQKTWRVRLRPVLWLCRIGAVGLLIVALSRPLSRRRGERGRDLAFGPSQRRRRTPRASGDRNDRPDAVHAREGESVEGSGVLGLVCLSAVGRNTVERDGSPA